MNSGRVKTTGGEPMGDLCLITLGQPNTKDADGSQLLDPKDRYKKLYV